MKPRLPLVVVVVFALVGLVSTGCNRKAREGAGADPAVDAEGKTAAAAVPARENPEAAQAISAADAALQKNDYDAAISALVQAQANQPAMSEEQKQKYQQSVRDTTTRLLEASQTDPKALEAYRNFGRMMTGR